MLNKIKELRQQLNQIKVIQPTTNDSYKFYKYTTPNLFEFHNCNAGDFECGRYYYEVEFVPYNNKENCIIQWFLFDPNATQFYNSIWVDSSDHTKCIASNLGHVNFIGYPFPTAPPILQEQYVSCISNVQGHLKYTRKAGTPF